MIQRPNNWNEVQEFTERQKLPLGAYICKIKQTTLQDNNYGSQLCVLFDIADGEFAGYYEKDFKSSTYNDKKWRGVLRLWVPLDDGTDKDEWTKSTFKGFVSAVEHSNPGYTWNWDERSLAGKMIGIMFRNEEWDYNGKHGWAVRPFRAISSDRVRSGEYTLPGDKALSTSNNTANAGYRDSFDALVGRVDSAFPEEELPF